MIQRDSAHIRELVKVQQWTAANAAIAVLVEQAFGFRPHDITINADQYSLNSLNGFLTASDGREFFFKFHQEEDEGEHVSEYYSAEILRDAGYPVDVPAYVSREIGRQMVLYRRRHDSRLADLCLAIECGEGDLARQIQTAQRRLDATIADRYLATLHPITPVESRAEPIHQLFHRRLVDHTDAPRLGGRAARFYVGATFELASVSLNWNEFARAHWSINGTRYRHSFGELLEMARVSLHPSKHADGGGVAAHGDAHNANVWCERRDASMHLSFFDPAFAGRHVPALLAEVKATFHNIFAHPFWLYDPKLAEPHLRISAHHDSGWLHVEHDWRLSDLRRDFLESKRDLVWRPLLQELKRRGWLQPTWQLTLRLALFCCPTLVINLVAGTSDRTPATSTLALAVAISLGSETEDGPGDELSRFVQSLSD